MQLGNFSLSLNVKDISASKAFYEKLEISLLRDWPVPRHAGKEYAHF